MTLLAHIPTNGEHMRNGGLAGGPALVEVRSQNHVHMKTEAWAKTAEASGLGVILGAGRFEG
jgi:hypothetical protein